MVRCDSEFGQGVYIRKCPLFLAVACGILVLWWGIKLVPTAVEAQRLNHWPAREVPRKHVLELVWHIEIEQHNVRGLLNSTTQKKGRRSGGRKEGRERKKEVKEGERKGMKRINEARAADVGNVESEGRSYVSLFYMYLKTFIIKKSVFPWTKLSSSLLIPGLPEYKTLYRQHTQRLLLDQGLGSPSCSGS